MTLMTNECLNAAMHRASTRPSRGAARRIGACLRLVAVIGVATSVVSMSGCRKTGFTTEEKLKAFAQRAVEFKQRVMTCYGKIPRGLPLAELGQKQSSCDLRRPEIVDILGQPAESDGETDVWYFERAALGGTERCAFTLRFVSDKSLPDLPPKLDWNGERLGEVAACKQIN